MSEPDSTRDAIIVKRLSHTQIQALKPAYRVCRAHGISVESDKTFYDGIGHCDSVEDVMEVSQCKEIYRFGDKYGEETNVEAAFQGLGVHGWI